MNINKYLTKVILPFPTIDLNVTLPPQFLFLSNNFCYLFELFVLNSCSAVSLSAGVIVES